MPTSSRSRLYFRHVQYKIWASTDVYAVHEIRRGREGWALMECHHRRLHQKNIKGQEWSEVKELIKISKLEINTIIRSWTRNWKIISERAIKKPFRASIKVITIKGSASSKCHEKLIMIANQKKLSLFSEGSEHVRTEMKQQREGKQKREGWDNCISPDPWPACAWPYAARAGCGKRMCSCRGGRQSSPRSSHGDTWCAPSVMSNACSLGHSRGRSTVGRRHLAFQVAGLYSRQQEGGSGEEEEEGGKGKRAKRSANQWQLTGGLPRVVWELSVQSAPHESLRVRLASHLLPTPHPHFLSHRTKCVHANVLTNTHAPSSWLYCPVLNAWERLPTHPLPLRKSSCLQHES